MQIIATIQPELSTVVREIAADTGELSERLFRFAVKDAGFEMKQLMSLSPASGRLYRRGGTEGRTRFHVASSAGNAPRNDSGALNNSINSKVTGHLEGEIEMLWYGEYLDRVLGRTFIEPAIDTAIGKTIERT